MPSGTRGQSESRSISSSIAPCFSAAAFGVPVLAPGIGHRYGLTLSGVGVVLASLSLGQMVTLLPWGLAADRFVERWQKLDQASQRQYQAGDMSGYKSTRAAMGDMAKSLQRDPQLESLLTNRKRELGIVIDDYVVKGRVVLQLLGSIAQPQLEFLGRICAPSYQALPQDFE